MKKDFDFEIICCFCGKPILSKDAMNLTISIDGEDECMQQLFCHKNHFRLLVDDKVVLHPMFTKNI